MQRHPAGMGLAVSGACCSANKGDSGQRQRGQAQLLHGRLPFAFLGVAVMGP